MAHDPIDTLRKSLESDRLLQHRRYPDQALYALLDTRIQERIRSRIDARASLTAINALEHDFNTGLNYIYFKFLPPGGIALTSDAFLIILDDSNSVIGIVDPFDPTRPNRLLPPLPEGGVLPFALARPSAQRDLTFHPDELYARDEATQRFFRKLQSISSGITAHREKSNPLPTDPPDGDGGPPSGGGSIGTQCTYSTQSRLGPYTTGIASGFPVTPDNADFKNDYDPDVDVDNMIDDSH